MLVLKSWLKDFVKIKLSDEELSDKLSLSGTSIDAIIAKMDPKIIVAQIREINPHPNADRLQIAKVFNGTDELQIVCGAPNIEVGQKVPLATIGAKIQDFEIKQAQIRGVDSFGMMCSDRELGLSKDHVGIKILPVEYEIGKSLTEYIESDIIFDIEITPNRGDSLSHIGVAREISAITNEELVIPKKIELVSSGQNNLKIEIDAADLCSQYYAILIKGVKVGPSPDWLSERLVALGSRPINNIVDITNYILLDWGQPLHAFDYGKLNQKQIVVRQAIENEKIVTLDGQVRSLTNNNLVIADAEKAIAIAGVMGGANSEVDNDTVDIVIESAEFNPASVRKTSKLMGLSTEASYRFERGINSGLVSESAKYAAKLILEMAGGVIEEIIFKGNEPERNIIQIEYEKINFMLGLGLTNIEIDKILIKLGFEIKSGMATIPTWRHDIGIWQDLAEEVGRIFGYNQIKLLEVESTSIHEESDYFKKEYIKDSLQKIGFSETVNYIFLSAQDVQTDELDVAQLLEIKNPMQKENKYLRNSLVPGLLKNLAKNPSFDPILLFEFGHIFNRKIEKATIGLVTAGKDAKKKIEEAVSVLSDIVKLEINIIKVNSEQLSRYKIRKSEVYSFELDIPDDINSIDLTKENEALEPSQTKVLYKQVSKYPPVVRDLAFVVSETVISDDISQAILESSVSILLADLFDEFSSPKFGIKKKNLAYHIYLQDLNNALTDGEADIIIKKIVLMVEDKFNAELRN